LQHEGEPHEEPSKSQKRKSSGRPKHTPIAASATRDYYYYNYYLSKLKRISIPIKRGSLFLIFSFVITNFLIKTQAHQHPH